MNFVAQYLSEAAQVAARIDHAAVESLVDLLADTRDGGGRLFVLGVGGSAGNASHAVNDFRKIAGFEAYAPTDNVSELTARINDDGWEHAVLDWRYSFGKSPTDLEFIFSVGGALDGLSANLRGAEYGIVGAKGGYQRRIVIPSESTPVIEGCQSVIAHYLVDALCD